MKIWEPKLLGTLWATPGLLRDCFTFTLINYVYLASSDGDFNLRTPNRV